MQIVSGVGKRTIVRLGFMCALLMIFAGWFAYDGWVRWPLANLEAARQAMPKAPAQLSVNPAATKEAAAALQATEDQPHTLADLRQRFGEPAFLGPLEGGEPGEQLAFFVGPYGWIRATLQGETASKIDWHDGAKGYSDIAVQRLLATALLAVAMLPLALLLRQLPRKFKLDDQGLALPATGQITYDQMTGIDATQFASKGIVQLKYRDQAGRDRTAVLDEEQIQKFDEIVAALCKVKGWPVDVEPVQADPDNAQQ